MIDQNPYAPPQTSDAVPASASDRNDVRIVVVAWERLRLVYNGVLFVLGMVVMVLWGSEGAVLILPGAVLVAIGANLCFFAGPLVELYAMALKRRGPWGRGARLLLFSSGLGFSALLFAAAALTAP